MPDEQEPVIPVRQLPQTVKLETVQGNGVAKVSPVIPSQVPTLNVTRNRIAKESEFAEVLEQLPDMLRSLISVLRIG